MTEEAPDTKRDQGAPDEEPTPTPGKGGPDQEVLAAIHEIKAAPSRSRESIIPSLKVVELYPVNGRVRKVDIAGRVLTDAQYRKALAVRRNQLEDGHQIDELDDGELADQILAKTTTREVKSIPGLEIIERDQFHRATLWSYYGETLTAAQCRKLRRRLAS